MKRFSLVVLVVLVSLVGFAPSVGRVLDHLALTVGVEAEASRSEQFRLERKRASGEEQ